MVIRSNEACTYRTMCNNNSHVYPVVHSFNGKASHKCVLNNNYCLPMHNQVKNEIP